MRQLALRLARHVTAIPAMAAVAIVIGGCGADSGERPASAATTAPPVAAAAPAPTLSCRGRTRRYRTLPNLRPVRFCVARAARAQTADGHLLVTPRRTGAGGENAAMILTDEARVLWYLRGKRRVHDLKTVRYGGRTLLALFHRRAGRRSFYELRDSRYRVVRRVTMGRPYGTDMHELQVTPAGTAYLGSYHRVRVRGHGFVVDYVIREIDLRTGRVLFHWRALEHVPVSATYATRRPGHNLDYFHGNSIEPPVPGDPTIIVSSRNTSAVYGISRRDGRVLWVLGGRRDQFRLAAAGLGRRFCAQHDARRLPNGDLLLFDNGGSGKGEGTGCPVHAARVLRFRLDVARRTASVTGRLRSREGAGVGRGILPIALGSARLQPNGNMLVSWGTKGRITEVTTDGRIGLLLRLSGSSYRAVRAPWVGRPGGHPRLLAVRRRGDRVELWASWNGATEIASWQVMAGRSAAALRDVGRARRFADLETRMRVRTRWPVVAVRALDASGRELGRSRPARIAAAR